MAWCGVASLAPAQTALAAPVIPLTPASHDLPFIHPIFDPHMVLPRDAEDSIWGWTEPGEKVTVVIQPADGGMPLQSKTALAGPDGRCAGSTLRCEFTEARA